MRDYNQYVRKLEIKVQELVSVVSALKNGDYVKFQENLIGTFTKALNDAKDENTVLAVKLDDALKAIDVLMKATANVVSEDMYDHLVYANAITEDRYDDVSADYQTLSKAYIEQELKLREYKEKLKQRDIDAKARGIIVSSLQSQKEFLAEKLLNSTASCDELRKSLSKKEEDAKTVESNLKAELEIAKEEITTLENKYDTLRSHYIGEYCNSRKHDM